MTVLFLSVFDRLRRSKEEACHRNGESLEWEQFPEFYCLFYVNLLLKRRACFLGGLFQRVAGMVKV